LILVIGTTATVYPAAGYVDKARRGGAKVAVINMDGVDGELGAASNLRDGDFLFQGDAAKILPEILKPIIGELEV
jgi:NAD-dependent deacetylase sirtuin 5